MYLSRCAVAKSCPTLQPHGLWHVRLPCPSPSLRVCSNSCIESVMPSNHLILWCPLLPSNLSHHQGLFQWAASLHQWTKYRSWSISFSTSPSSEYSGLIFFRIGWFDLLAAQGTPKSLLQPPKFESISSLVLSFLYDPTLISVHDYWENHSFEYTDLCWQSNVSAF